MTLLTLTSKPSRTVPLTQEPPTTLKHLQLPIVLDLVQQTCTVVNGKIMVFAFNAFLTNLIFNWGTLFSLAPNSSFLTKVAHRTQNQIFAFLSRGMYLNLNNTPYLIIQNQNTLCYNSTLPIWTVNCPPACPEFTLTCVTEEILTNLNIGLM